MSELVKNLIKRFEYNRKHKKNYLLVLLAMAVLLAGGVTWGLRLTGVSVTAEDTEVSDALETYGLLQGASAEEGTQETESTEVSQTREISNLGVSVQADSDATSTVTTSDEYYYVYFAAPVEWTSNKYTIKFNARRQSDKVNWVTYDMTDTGNTLDGRNVYFVQIPKDQIDNNGSTAFGGYSVVQFQAYQGTTQKGIQEISDWSNISTEKNWVDISNIKDKIYDGSSWSDYNPGPAKLAGKKLFFKNDTFTKDTKFTFYVNETKVDESELSYSNKKSVWSYKFPTDSDATVETELKVVVNGVTYIFQWDDLTNNMVVVSNGSASVSEKFTSTTNVVYFDATLSKLSYSGTTEVLNSGQGMPYSDSGSIYCYVTKADKTGGMAITLSKVDTKTIGSNTWSDVWKVDIPDGYTRIRFTAWENPKNEDAAANGDGTAMYDIPDDLEQPCFYADTSDKVIYDGGNRGGYWDEVYTIHDAEKGKNTSVNNIPSSTFTKNSDTLYVNSTLYDYYSDYELNGKGRNNYGDSNGASYKNWVTFRQFDQALSDYYKNANVSYPIYTGHFQPDYFKDFSFSGIADTLNLFGYTEKVNSFMAVNNSTIDEENGKGTHYSDATQGLVAQKLKNGVLQTAKNEISEPHFNSDFLNGENSKNTKIGETYNNVSFPFTKKVIYRDEPGVEYWWYDSASTSLLLNKVSGSDKYYLKGLAGTQDEKCLNVKSSGTNVGTDSVSTAYGYFPFNNHATKNSGSTYNFGFGTQMSLKFRLTKDGTVETSENKSAPIRFRFSGDDDVWVFIDGQLVLDCGGSHGKVTGMLDFENMMAYVSGVKTAGDKSLRYEKINAKTLYYKAGGTDGKTEQLETYNWSKSFSSVISKGDQKEHTLTLFYMERGMWESNMSVAFNFPDENTLQVQKKVDTDNVAEQFKEMFDNQSIFSFLLKNRVTHYKDKGVEGQTVDPVTFAKEFSGTLTHISNNVFEKTTKDDKTVVHWMANYSNAGRNYTDKRLGTFTSDTGNSIDASSMKYLKFDIFYQGTDPRVDAAYLVLYDNNENKAYGFLNGKLYGNSVIEKNSWSTLTVELSKLTVDAGFDWKNISKIGFQYDASRNIYLSNFVFYPKVTVTGKTGFIVKQEDIPDYGSVSSKELEVVNGAQYTSTVDNDTYVIGNDGVFSLQNEELITFHDQFRRGSYLQLTEQLSDIQKQLFDTSWTMYENDQEVSNSLKGSFSTVSGEDKSLINQSGTQVDDGRTEKIDSTSSAANYMGVRPDGNCFIFRSYSNPDSTSIFNRQKIVFTNKVKTGTLTITKKQADNSEELSGKYTFYVVFSNVGGMGLEDAPVTMGPFELSVNESKKIEGIPVNTSYQVYEVKATDGSKLESVTIDGTDVSALVADGVIKENDAFSIDGSISGDTDKNNVIFTNTKVPTGSITVKKKWIGQGTKEQNVVVLQLQRRSEKAEESAPWDVVPGYEQISLSAQNNKESEDTKTETVIWSKEINDLEVYADVSNKVKYKYRLVELQQNDDGTMTVIADRGTFDKSYLVQYQNAISFEEFADTSNGFKDGELTVINEIVKYELPKTGAIGTKVFATAGSVIMVLGLMVFLIMRMPEGVHTNKCSKKGKRGRKK